MKSRKSRSSKSRGSRKHVPAKKAGNRSKSKSGERPSKRPAVEEMSITQLTNLARSYGIPFYGLTRSKLEKKLRKYL